MDLIVVINMLMNLFKLKGILYFYLLFVIFVVISFLLYVVILILNVYVLMVFYLWLNVDIDGMYVGVSDNE